MDNTMDINLGDNNPMKSLSFYWEAEFKNGKVINQFDNNTDTNYAIIKSRLKELSWFILYNKNNPNDKFIVDLQNGFIYRNKIMQDFCETDNKIEKNNIRLIYFRRKRVIIQTPSNKQELIIHYFLGFQYNDKLGNNRQIVLQIDADGSFIIGD